MLKFGSFRLWPTTVAVFFFVGCAVNTPSPQIENKKTVMVDSKTQALEALRPGLRILEDSLVLELLLAYRELHVKSTTQGTPDRETLRKGKNSYNQLEYILRKGGLHEKGQDGRAFILEGGEKLTLQELTVQLSRVMLKAGANGDWKGASERAREIQKRRPELSTLVEDAGWCLTITETLESQAFAEDFKKRLRFLHESYAREAPHDEIVKSVNSLLKEVTDDKLRKELKKLANRSWERDKRMGKFSERLATVKPDSTVTKPVQNSGKNDSLPAHSNQNMTSNNMVSDSVMKSLRDQVDTLAIHGNYLEALKVIEMSEEKIGADWAKEKKLKLGGRYCEERRSAAAAAYSLGKKAVSDSLRVKAYRQSIAQLDSCLFNFPESPVATKVRRNREMVEKDLKR